jgi:hypothetical protein
MRRKMMHLTIDRVENGYRMVYEDEDTIEALVFEEPENCEKSPDPQTVSRLLYEVIEHLGAYGSKYDKERVRVVVERGEKYMDCDAGDGKDE